MRLGPKVVRSIAKLMQFQIAFEPRLKISATSQQGDCSATDKYHLKSRQDR